jgi:arylsulfatase A-like enzyme
MTTRKRQLTLLAAVLAPGVTAAAMLSWFRRPVAAWPPAPEPAAGAVLNRLDLRDLQTPDPSQRSDRILLITLDTLRADHMSCYEYPRQTTPFIDSIAAEGVRFTRAFAPMSTTAPSHTSMLTGLYPLQHGVVKNGHRLSDDVGTLPEILASAGFETAGFVSTNRHFAAGNIHQGFAHFDEPAPEGLQLQYRPAGQTLAEARAWLAQTPPPQRLFLWIHLFDPHEPYVERPVHLDAVRAGDNEADEAWLEFVRREHHVVLRPGADYADGRPDDRLAKASAPTDIGATASTSTTSRFASR